ncbi:thioredoxin fold domain-containing protein [Reichenbachiella agarivorans]|uniref:Thioredoxin fold domain-containing protein n=1 Tax=Reichenbachiella agarivorans TaxID=2979464 RepID=A0ABY6D0P6_9BACT|nr:thioredoxin fold domain-containing protein [Reichenbachiella agarivorans]UXP34050.1 thioredoxin fold domain-containing protein [Reichenbachiella agarivorans]
MKSFLIIFSIAISLNQMVFAQGEKSIKWLGIEEAQTLAKENAKPIFVDFTAEWCGWCKKMDQTTFSDVKVAKVMNEGYYAVKLDFESKDKFEFKGKKITAKELAQRMEISGLPTMIVLSSDLSSHQKIVGYKKSDDFLETLSKL